MPRGTYNRGMQNSSSQIVLRDALARCGFAQTLSEYHGALLGALCVREVTDPQVVPPLEPDAYDLAASKKLIELRFAAIEQLASQETLPELLLPDDELPLAERTKGLVEWCEGFLFGMSSGSRLKLEHCSEDLRDFVADITQFTRMELDTSDEAGEADAFEQLVEYLRVGAQMAYFELAPLRAPQPVQH